MSETVVSKKLTTMEEARAKAEEAAGVIQAYYPGSFTKWISPQRLQIMDRFNNPVATVHLETLQ